MARSETLTKKWVSGAGGNPGSLHPVSQVRALPGDIDAAALALMAAARFSLLIVFVFG